VDARRTTGAGRLHLVKPDSSEPWLGGHVVPTILVVDDEDAIRDFLRSALEAEGYRVLAADDGEAALTLCERHPPDLILLDLMMPRLDGLGFLHEFRRRSRHENVPVYIMSAVRTAADHARAAGVTGVFLKPFDLDELLDTIAHALPRRGGLGGGASRERFMHA